MFVGTQKDFFKIYGQFGHMPLKRLASPALQFHIMVSPTSMILCDGFQVAFTIHV